MKNLTASMTAIKAITFVKKTGNYVFVSLLHLFLKLPVYRNCCKVFFPLVLSQKMVLVICTVCLLNVNTAVFSSGMWQFTSRFSKFTV